MREICVKIFVLPFFPEGAVLHGHIMLMQCVPAPHYFQLLPKTTWFGYKNVIRH